MRDALTETRTMTVYAVPMGHGYNYAATNGGYGRVAVPEGQQCPYNEGEDDGYDPTPIGTFEGEWVGEDGGWGDCTFRCTLGTCHAIG